MKKEEAIKINTMVGDMLLTYQREYPYEYQNGCFNGTNKICGLYGKLAKHRNEIAEYLISVMET